MKGRESFINIIWISSSQFHSCDVFKLSDPMLFVGTSRQFNVAHFDEHNPSLPKHSVNKGSDLTV